MSAAGELRGEPCAGLAEIVGADEIRIDNWQQALPIRIGRVILFSPKGPNALSPPNQQLRLSTGAQRIGQCAILQFGRRDPENAIESLLAEDRTRRNSRGIEKQ